MANFVIYNYQFARITEPDKEFLSRHYERYKNEQ